MRPHLQQLAFLVCLIFFISAFPLFPEESPFRSDAEATLVIYNSKEPRSEEIARTYANARHIPKSQILGLECPREEEISRGDYNHHLLLPIQEFTRQQNLIKYESISHPSTGVKFTRAIESKLRFIVLCHGIPLKISEEPSIPVPKSLSTIQPEFRINRASVDGELAMLPTPTFTPCASIENPLFEKTFSQSAGWNSKILCVARLDGPDPDSVLQMIHDTLEAEKLGLHGRAFFDSRSITLEPYMPGDQWIITSAQLFENQGWETMDERKPDTLGPEVDVSDCAIYSGWYASNINGPFYPSSFRFQKGAIAYHLHSWSASTLRSPQEHWAGPLVKRGAVATLGCVYEPYLQLTPRIDVLFKRLLEGCSFGEAAYSAQEFLSWMTTVVGDPLYRPFAISNDERIQGFEARFENLTPAEKNALAWCYRLKTRQIFMTDKKEEAIKLATHQAERLENAILWEGLALLHQQSNHHPQSLQAAEKGLLKSPDPLLRKRLLRIAARSAAKARNWDKSIENYRILLTRETSVTDSLILSEEAEKAAHDGNLPQDALFFRNLRPTPPSK